MTCEHAAPSLSALVDGELDAAVQPEVFAHLHSCASCRAFLADALRARGVLRRDRDALATEADAVLAARPHPARRAAPHGRAPSTALAWATFAIGVAALLLASGIAIGTSVARRGGESKPRPVQEASAPEDEDTNVVYVCSMPEYRVVSTPLPDAPK